MFKKKRSYYSYSSYGKPQRDYKKVGIIAFIVVVVLALFTLLFKNRIVCMIKGYSFSETNLILKQDKEAKKEILSHDKMNQITNWINTSKKASFYDEYQKYYDLHQDKDVKVTVSNVDTIFEQYADKLGYTNKQLWDAIKVGDANGIALLAQKGYSYDQISPFLKVKSCSLDHMPGYLSAYAKNGNANYAVLITNYPFIDSRNSTQNKKYYITNTNDVDILVKKGFYFDSKYVPKDLVDLKNGEYKVKVAPDCEDAKMKKEAAKALIEMFNAAKADGYDLVVNSSYRSYAAQKSVYDEYHRIYDPVTAASLVADPGASEHQTGLGVDLTCQAVLDDKDNGITNTRFSYKPDYTWCKENSYKYGYILRFEESKSPITGIANEPWHFRYVGKKVAKTCYENGWTLEEYTLNTGNVPDLKQ